VPQSHRQTDLCGRRSLVDGWSDAIPWWSSLAIPSVMVMMAMTIGLVEESLFLVMVPRWWSRGGTHCCQYCWLVGIRGRIIDS
jgi:hypothetical protein